MYPELARFMQTFHETANKCEKHFIKWKEGVRKDIERVFSILKAKFRYLATTQKNRARNVSAKWQECMFFYIIIALKNDSMQVKREILLKNM